MPLIPGRGHGPYARHTVSLWVAGVQVRYPRAGVPLLGVYKPGGGLGPTGNAGALVRVNFALRGEPPAARNSLTARAAGGERVW